jgi:hypothetical protein
MSAVISVVGILLATWVLTVVFLVGLHRGPDVPTIEPVTTSR